jgi:formylmethanofuran dehydrogenase subunit E
MVKVMKICSYTYEEYIDLVKSFHGSTAPGILIGGFMVDLARSQLPEEGLYDALCETRACLPDAIQLLTPCTVGNGWLKVINLGRYALSLYEKYSGEGVRVYVDPEKLKEWPKIYNWFFKLTPKKDQDLDLLLRDIREAGSSYYGIQKVKLKPSFIKIVRRRGFAVCPMCGESYPLDDGGICRACQGEIPYIEAETREEEGPILKSVPVDQAIGERVLHDMTQIIPGEKKGPAFKRDQELSAGDICRLQTMGRQNIYVQDTDMPQSQWVHEDQAALAFAKAMAGEGVIHTETPSEGKAELIAERDGLMILDDRRLEMFNLVPGVMCASRHGFSLVDKGFKLAGTRAIPLYLPRRDFERAMTILSEGPLFKVLPLRLARVGILVTGTEVFQGLIKDKFIPTISHKIERFGSQVVSSLIVPDDRDRIRAGIEKLLADGADLIVTTAGLSVDPDDVTRQGLRDAGVEDMLYGMPILPGAMTLLARKGNVPVIGVPACALYYKTTSFDILLPRLLAGVTISRHDLAKIGNGGLCLDCKTCTFPKCPFCK